MTLSIDNPIELRWRGENMTELAAVLDENPQVWNRNRLRTADQGPHRHISDVWVRCLDMQTMLTNPLAFNEPHESSWYPEAEELPILKTWAEAILEAVAGVELGGVLITKIPAGTCVMPHIDQGWHARHYEKFALQIKANGLQEFCFTTKRLVTKPGDVFTFDNRYTHWVTNPSPEDRITMICCVRREG